MKCPVCNENNHAKDAVFCHMCGSRLIDSDKHWGFILLIVVFLSIIAGILIYSNNSSSTGKYDEVRNTVQFFCGAAVNNDYNKLSRIYASQVNRFFTKNNVQNSDVIEEYRNYDKKFGICGHKRINVRWETLHIWQSNNGYSVVFRLSY